MKISVIGAGAMGGAIVEGLIKGNYIDNKDICVSDPSRTALERFTEKVQNITTDNCMAAMGGEVVFVVVKPWLVEKVLKDIKEVLDYAHQRLIVVAAGISSEQLKTWLDKDGQMISTWLCIPNIAIAQLASMSFGLNGTDHRDRRETAGGRHNTRLMRYCLCHALYPRSQ